MQTNQISAMGKIKVLNFRNIKLNLIKRNLKIII
jgi:hypothetical protein